MTCNRCTDYALYCEFLDNWLATVGNHPSVTTDEIYAMALWTKMIRERILTSHMLAFTEQLQIALDIAMWEFDLAATLRFFRSVPPSARNYGLERLIAQLKNPYLRLHS